VDAPRLFVLCRHAESELNVLRRVNGDPTIEVPLTRRGEQQAQMLGDQLRNVPIDVCAHSRFGRTRRTAELVLAGRAVEIREQPLLDDVDVGDLEGASLDAYRAWKQSHARRDAFPGGESLDDAARRYARGFEALLALPASVVLAVVHEIPIRYAANAAAASSDLDWPVHAIGNCVPYLFDEEALRRAIKGIRRAVG
jgi:broad specificity phosphatase PhoE